MTTAVRTQSLPVFDTCHARRGAWLGLAAILAALTGFAAVCYVLPTGYNARWWGINPLGVHHWAAHLHFPLPDALSAAHWAMLFRVSLCALWGGYAVLTVCTRRAPILSVRQTLCITGFVSLVLALFAPPLLATDPYAYAAYARLSVLYGQNPYIALPWSFLSAAHDPAQYFLAWDLPTVYGPVWTGLSIALVRTLPHGWLWGEVLGMKLIAACALPLAAWSAGRVAERLQPGHGRWATLAVGLNPLLLLEGPATGHNDLLMMACVLMSVSGFLDGKYARAGLWLGLAIGIKALPLALLPWLAIVSWRTHAEPQRRLRAILCLTGCALLPSVLGYAAFWHGMATFAPLHNRAHTGHSTLLPAALAYTGLTLWLVRAQSPQWLTAWSGFCAVLMLTGMGFAFPWYGLWVWPPLLVQRGRVGAAFSAAVFAASLVWESLYGALVPLRVLLGQG